MQRIIHYRKQELITRENNTLRVVPKGLYKERKIMGLFSKKFIDPREYTTEGSYGMVYLYDNVVHSKKLQNELCFLLTQGGQTHKTLKQLSNSAYHTLLIYDHNADRCFSVCRTTDNPDTFFKRWQEGMEWYSYEIEIEKYVYNGIMPGAGSMRKAENRKQIEIRHLIDRVYAKASEKAAKAKTDRTFKKCYVSAYEKLSKYRIEFDQASKTKLLKKFSKYIQ